MPKRVDSITTDGACIHQGPVTCLFSSMRFLFTGTAEIRVWVVEYGESAATVTISRGRDSHNAGEVRARVIERVSASANVRLWMYLLFYVCNKLGCECESEKRQIAC